MKIFVERPIATVMVFLVAASLGAYSFLNLPLELAPNENFPQVTIRTAWNDVSAEVVQTQITSPLEAMASLVKGVRKISSSSSFGLSSVVLEFDPKTNADFANLEIRERITRLRQALPHGAGIPQIIPYVPEDFRTADFLHYAISGEYSLNELRTMLKDKLYSCLIAVKGVAGVEVWGGSDPEIGVTLDIKKTQSLDITPEQAIEAINRWNQTYPAGKVQKGKQEYLVKIMSSLKDMKELQEMIVAFRGGVAVQLKNIAGVEYVYSDTQDLNRINGQPTLRLIIYKEKGANTLAVAKSVKARLREIVPGLPPDLIFRPVNDESAEIKRSLKELGLLGIAILIIIFSLVFFMLRSISPSLLILSSIAFSILITVHAISLFKIPVNMLTLGALTLGFGLFVDNSVVVFENILRLWENGFSPIRAASQGPQEVFLAVLASTLTTVSVFFCFPFFQGRLKIYYLPLGVVMTSALCVSLLVSFTLMPALGPRLLKTRKKKRRRAGRCFYSKFLALVLGHPLEVLAASSLLFCGSYKWFKKEVAVGEFFRWHSRDRLIISFRMPSGTGLDRTDEIVRRFEAQVLEADCEKEMNTRVSTDSASIEIAFPPEVEYSFHPYVLKEQLITFASQFAGLSVAIHGFGPRGYFSGYGIGARLDSSIAFSGYDLKGLKEIVAEVEQLLKMNPRIKETRLVSSEDASTTEDFFEYVLKIDWNSPRISYIESEHLYHHLNAVLQGKFFAPVMWRAQGKDMAVSFKFSETQSLDIEALQNSLIRTRSGEYFKLGEITTLEKRPIAGSIARENQQFRLKLMWGFKGPAKSAKNYEKAVFSNLKLPPGFSASLDDTQLLTEREKSQMKFALLVSLALIFMILASLYESYLEALVVILAVPLALIGVFVAFIIVGYSFDSSAYIGVILLTGIVVNNAILLVNHMNLKVKQGLPLLDAVIAGAKDRVRPIVLTTSTTVLGTLPLIVVQREAGASKMWGSLALSIVGGMTSSALLVLIIVPVFYFYGKKFRLRGTRHTGRLKKASEKD